MPDGFRSRSSLPDPTRPGRGRRRSSGRLATRQGAALILAVLSLLPVAGCNGDPDALEPGPATVSEPSQGSGEVVLLEDISGLQVFPPDNWWNLDVSDAPVDPGSEAYLDWISGRTPENPDARQRLHPDFGPPPYGIPFVGVPSTQPLRPVTFVLYPDESDPGVPGGPIGYPIPDEAYELPNYIEGGVPGGGPSGDRHLLVIDRDRWILFETWATSWNDGLSRWEAGSGAIWDLSRNDRRPEGWTSADAAGLAVFPGLIRYDELDASPEIHHAFRFTTRATNGYVWPASHQAGSTEQAPPMGTRLRMKPDVDLGSYPPEMQKIFRAMKSYGLILADNGSDLYITGTMDPRWDNDVLNPAFHSLDADDFEVIELGWNPETSGVPTWQRGTSRSR